MEKIVTLMMYVLWIATIAAVLAATFTNFQYTDLDIIAIGIFLFAFLNSLLVYARNKVDERLEDES